MGNFQFPQLGIIGFLLTADQRIDELAGGRPRTLVIKGPHQSGKSSLLLRYLALSQQAGHRVSFIDLSLLGHPAARGFGEFAAEFAELLADELDLGLLDLPQFDRALDLTRFIEEKVLTRVDGEILIAIDDADRIIGCPWQEDFYSALRGWDAKRSRPGRRRGWERLGLALAIATDPKMLIESGYTSPFNVGDQIRLSGFTRAEVSEFNVSYGQMLDAAQLDRLFGLLHGHPFLTPLAFYRLLADNFKFDALCREATAESGPFGDHLRARVERLYAAGLADAMREILRRGTVPGQDRRLFYRLEAAGLAREEGGRIVPGLELYRSFFEAVL